MPPIKTIRRRAKRQPRYFDAYDRAVKLLSNYPGFYCAIDTGVMRAGTKGGDTSRLLAMAKTQLSLRKIAPAGRKG